MKVISKSSQVAIMLILLVVKVLGEGILGFAGANILYKNSQKEVVESGSGGLDFSMPTTVMEVCENEEGYIVITTEEKAFVRSPIDCVVCHIEKDGMKGVKIVKFGYCCYVLGFEFISVVDNVKVKSGDVLGSLETNKLYVKIYKNENRISLKTIRKMFNV